MPNVAAARSAHLLVLAAAAAVAAAAAAAAVAATAATAARSPGGQGPVGPLQAFHAPVFGLTAETTVEFFPVADAYVDEADPDASFPKAGVWPVERRTDGTVRRTFLQFDTSAIPAGVAIVRAELEVYLNTGSGGGPGVTTARVNVDAIGARWDPDGVTWTDRPPVGGIIAGLDVDTTPGPRTFDVRYSVVSWVRSPTSNHGVQLRGADGGRYARLFRATGNRRPRLRIVYADAAGMPSAPPSSPATTATAPPTVEPTPPLTPAPATPPATDAPPPPTPRPAEGSATPVATPGGAAGRALLPAVLCAGCRAAGTER